MKKVLTAVVALSLLATPILADMPEGCSETGFRPFDEDIHGNNCPATEVEKTIGDGLTFVFFAAILADLAGKGALGGKVLAIGG